MALSTKQMRNALLLLSLALLIGAVIYPKYLTVILLAFGYTLMHLGKYQKLVTKMAKYKNNQGTHEK